MTENEQYSLLLYKYLQGTLSQEEQELLGKWLAAGRENRKLLEELSHEDSLAEAVREYHPENRSARQDRILAAIRMRTKMGSVVPLYRRSFFRVAVAASILLFIAAGGYFLFFHRSEKRVEVVKTEAVKDVEAPRITKAMITLADGRTVSVDSINSGMLAQQANVKVTKSGDGKIVYSGNASELVYNTLTNPRGSKVIDMALADGSHVWLNAGSSITYPVSFMGNERKVSVNGEAYFEIAHHAARPFIVSKNDVAVTVLGTHFNVNAYDDETGIKVTLLEGSVNVSNKVRAVTIRPGQQAQVTDNLTVRNNVDVEQVIAWKNGLFSFDGAGFREVMREIARWYDLEVSYAGAVPAGTFKGKIGRDLSLSDLLAGLSSSRIRYKTEPGRRIVILPE